ncbi:MAG: DUF1003 domain-containing protein [Armatimonadetes bacterium]|nr:DUF1003 domain-containing protein [Armatimonadota bacterium]
MDDTHDTHCDKGTEDAGRLRRRLSRLRFPAFNHHSHPPVQNANDVYESRLSLLDKLAVYITDHVGSIGFFIIILAWTLIWTGYNALATEFKALHWKAFDPYPAFVVYLLISNVIQILLMPLIMVGQNIQGRHSETRADLDFEVNMKAEKEVAFLLKHLRYNTDLLLRLMAHVECHLSDEEIAQIGEELESLKEVANADPPPLAAADS